MQSRATLMVAVLGVALGFGALLLGSQHGSRAARPAPAAAGEPLEMAHDTPVVPKPAPEPEGRAAGTGFAAAEDELRELYADITREVDRNAQDCAAMGAGVQRAVADGLPALQRLGSLRKTMAPAARSAYDDELRLRHAGELRALADTMRSAISRCRSNPALLVAMTTLASTTDSDSGHAPH